jgi:hypothetical protein
MSDAVLDVIRSVIQEDVGNRGLRTDPDDNLVTRTAGDFAAACRSIAGTRGATIAVVTGFYIPHADPPCAETDGPLGALFLARALAPVGIRVVLATDAFCRQAVDAGLRAAGLATVVRLVTLPFAESPEAFPVSAYWKGFVESAGEVTHLIALERVGPSHTPQSLLAQPGTPGEVYGRFLAEVAREDYDRCHTMKGRDITDHMSPAHLLFEAAAQHSTRVATIGIGDGGNEIGMGKIPWDVIRRNIPAGAAVACRVPADHLIVCGVSNWGAYGLAAGVRHLRGSPPDPELFDPDRERELLRIMVKEGPLVDGVTGKPTVTVDGLKFERYAEPLVRLRGIV